MGTNFYRKYIPQKKDYEEMHVLVDNKDLDKLGDLLKKFEDSIHICKRSCGWEILFDHNWGKYYKLGRKDLENFLSEPGTIIVDEYGKTYTPTKFWNMIDSWNNTPGLISDKDIVKQDDYYACTFEKLECKEILGITPEYNDFKIDNIRFAVFSDFS